MNLLKIENNGQDIVSTNFFSFAKKAFYVSVNAGGLRLLLPKYLESDIPEMKTGKYAVVSISHSAFEIMFEDDSDSPFSMHSEIAAIDRIPDELLRGDLTLSVWISPCVKVFEMPAKIRKVNKIPYMRKWGSAE